MDSVEVVQLGLPLCDSLSNLPRGEPTASAYPAHQPPAFELHDVSIGHKVATRIQDEEEMPTDGESTGPVDGNAMSVEKSLDESKSKTEYVREPERSSCTTQMELSGTVDIEVDIPVDVGSRSHKQAIVVVSEETDRVGILIGPADRSSNVDGIDVQLLLEEARLDVSQAQLVVLAKEEDSTSTAKAVEAVGIEIMEGCSNVVDGADVPQADQSGGPHSNAGIDALVVVSAETVLAIDISVADEEGQGGADERNQKDLGIAGGAPELQGSANPVVQEAASPEVGLTIERTPTTPPEEEMVNERKASCPEEEVTIERKEVIPPHERAKIVTSEGTSISEKATSINSEAKNVFVTKDAEDVHVEDAEAVRATGILVADEELQARADDDETKELDNTRETQVKESAIPVLVEEAVSEVHCPGAAGRKSVTPKEGVTIERKVISPEDEEIERKALSPSVKEVTNERNITTPEEGMIIEERPTLPHEEGVTAVASDDSKVFELANAEKSEAADILDTGGAPIDIRESEKLKLPEVVCAEPMDADNGLPTDFQEILVEESTIVLRETLHAEKTIHKVVLLDEALNASDSATAKIEGISLEASAIVEDMDGSYPTEESKVDGVIDSVSAQPLLSKEDVNTGHSLTSDSTPVLIEGRSIVIELNNIFEPKEAKTENLADRVVSRELVSREAANAGNILISNMVDHSAEESSIIVDLDSANPLIASEGLDDTTFESIGQRKPGRDGGILENASSKSAISEDGGSLVSIKPTEEESAAREPDCSNLVTATIIEIPSEDISIVGAELSTSTALKDEVNETQEDLAEMKMDDGSAEDAPVEKNEDLVQEKTSVMISDESTDMVITTKDSTKETEDSTIETKEEIVPGERETISGPVFEKCTETTTETVVVETQVEKVENDTDMGSAERTEVSPAVVAVTMEDEGSVSMITATKTMAEKDVEMESADLTREVKTITEEESIVEEAVVVGEGVASVAVDVRGSDEEVETQGELIGVGSTVERSGLKITEIAEAAALVEECRAEPFIVAPPLEEQSIDTINDLPNNVEGKDSESPDSLAVVVEDDVERKSAMPAAGKIYSGGIVTEITQSKPCSPCIVAEETTAASLKANTEPAIFIDRIVELGPAAIVASEKEEADRLDLEVEDDTLSTASPALDGSVEKSKECVDFINSIPGQLETVGEIADEPEVARRENVQTIFGLEKVSPDICVSKDGLGISKATEVAGETMTAPGSDYSAPTPELVLISVDNSQSGTSLEKYSLNENPKDFIEQATSLSIVEGDNKLEEASTNGLGLAFVEPGDSSVLKDLKEDLARSLAMFVPADMTVDGSKEEREESSAFCRSKDIQDNSSRIAAEVALEKNEKKRGREEEDTITEDTEKTSKSAKTINGEISEVTDEVIDVKIENAKVDKKRSRDASDALAESQDLVKAKAAKTLVDDDDAGAQSRKSDVDEDADIEVEEQVNDDDILEEGNSTMKPHKKRKIALFLGYCGAGYQGMQRNPGAITIEGELEEALFRAGAIAETNYGDPKKVNWMRAARTDKGVSAVGQVVSGSFFIDPPGFIERVNSHLPKQIRVYGYKRVTASFNAKKLCDRRKYEYVLPVYAFDPAVHLDRETTRAQSAKEEKAVKKIEELNSTTIKIPGGDEGKEDMIIDSAIKKDETVTGKGMINAVEPNSEGIAPVGEAIVTELSEVGSVTTNAEEITVKDESCSNGMGSVHEEVNVVAKVTLESQSESLPESEEAAKGTVTSLKEAAAFDMEEIVVKDESCGNGMCNVQEEVNRVTHATIESPSTSFQANEGKPAELNSTMAKDDAPVGLEMQAEQLVVEQREVMETIEATAEGLLSPEEKKLALDQMVKDSTFRFGETALNRLNRILRSFVGSHNFHNFTARVKADDPSAQRYIVSFETDGVFTVGGMEFVRCSVVGQSFMLHQIRKMVGLAVAIMRGSAPESIVATALRRDTKLNVPMAPELGLLLEECYYSSYNNRFSSTHEEVSLKSYSGDVKEFKTEFIYPHIVSTEAKDSTFALWLHSINDRHFPDFAAARERDSLAKSQ